MNEIFLSFNKDDSDCLDSNLRMTEEGLFQNGKLIFANDYCRDLIIREYRKMFINRKFSFENKIDLCAFHTTVSRSVFIPIGSWTQLIDHALNKGLIKKTDLIRFSISTKKPVICVLEAEGESQGSFLYKSSYFLPFFIEQHMINLGFTNIIVDNRCGFTYSVKKFVRGLSFIGLKYFQQIIYKIHAVLFIRNYRISGKYIIATRGIIQTHFIKSLTPLFKKDTYSIVVNESSIFPFQNLKHIQKSKNPHSFIEGIIPFKRISRDFLFTLQNFLIFSLFKKKQVVSFFGLELDFNQIVTELFIFKYYCEIQGLSIKYARKINQNSSTKIFCFDMLTPQPYYIKKHNSDCFVAQIQTTLMAAIKQENFVFTDKFFFTDRDTYEGHVKHNFEYASKFDLLADLKYASLIKSNKVDMVRNVVYFTQPVFFEQEIKLINFLNKYFSSKGIVLQLKLHPRSVATDYTQFSNPIINAVVDSLDIIKVTDLVLTRNSSIGLDAWKLNVPVMFFVHESLNNKGIAYIPNNFKGSFLTTPNSESMDYFLDNLNSLFYDYNFLKIPDNALKGLEKILVNIGNSPDYNLKTEVE